STTQSRVTGEFPEGSKGPTKAVVRAAPEPEKPPSGRQSSKHMVTSYRLVACFAVSLTSPAFLFISPLALSHLPSACIFLLPVILPRAFFMAPLAFWKAPFMFWFIFRRQINRTRFSARTGRQNEGTTNAFQKA